MCSGRASRSMAGLVRQQRAAASQSGKSWGAGVAPAPAGNRGRAGVSPLAGTAWRLLVLDGKDTDAGVTSMLVFNADGTINGNGGCNTFGGDVTIDGATLKFGELRSTMMACEEAKSHQEAAFHEAPRGRHRCARDWRACPPRHSGQRSRPAGGGTMRPLL